MQAQDKNLALLAQRYPLLIADLQKALADNPQAAVAPKYPSQTLFVERQGGQTLLDCYDPAQTREALSQLPDDQPLLHLFATAGQFILFISRADAESCIADPRWEPILLPTLNGSEHLQRWLQTHTPTTWPWMIEGRDYQLGHSQSEYENFSRHLLAICEFNAREFSGQIAPRYENRPTPQTILQAEGRPLRIMVAACIASSYQQFCARDMHQALQTIDGVEPHLLIFSATPWNVCEVYRQVLDFDPDVLLLNGNDRRSMPDLPDGLCILSWDQDDCLASHNYHQHARPHDRLMVMVEEWKARALAGGLSSSRVSHLNLGANPSIYYPQPQDQMLPPRYDVLFVGNIYGFEQYKPMINFDEIDAANQKILIRARQLLDQWIDQQDPQSPYVIPDCNDLIARAFTELRMAPVTNPRIKLQFFYYLRYRIAHMLVREKYLAALGDYKLGLFGKGWDKIPQVADQAQGVIQNGDELRQAIYDSAIVLHLHTWTVHHPRLYDTAAAGGFLLVGRVPEQNEIETVYQPGEELDTFGSIAELKNKIDYYLEHPQKRQAMAKHAARRTRSEHTMTSRMQQMLRTLKQDEQYLQPENAADRTHTTVRAES